MTANRSMSSGPPSDEFYFQLNVKRIQLANPPASCFRVALCSGLRTVSCTQQTFSHDKPVTRCILNFSVPCHSTYQQGYTLKLLSESDEVASVNLNLKPIIAEYLFHNVGCHSKTEKLGMNGEIEFVAYIQKSRVMLIKEVLKNGDQVDKDIDKTDKYLDMEDKLRDKSEGSEKGVINQIRVKALNQLLDDNSILSKTSTKSSRLRPPAPLISPVLSPRQPSQTAADRSIPAALLSPKQVQSPLIKIMKGKINVTQSVHNAQRREQLIKHSKSQKIMIKRADSIDEDEVIKQKKNVKVFFVIMLVLMVGFLMGTKWHKQPEGQKGKHKGGGQGKARRKAGL